MGGQLLLERPPGKANPVANPVYGGAKISKASDIAIDKAIDIIKKYAIKQWGSEGATDILENLDRLGKELRNCRDNKVGTDTPWNFGDAKLASMVQKMINRLMKDYKLKATLVGEKGQERTEVSIAYYGPPPIKRIDMEG